MIKSLDKAILAAKKLADYYGEENEIISIEPRFIPCTSEKIPCVHMEHESFFATFHVYEIKEREGDSMFNYEASTEIGGVRFFCIY